MIFRRSYSDPFAGAVPAACQGIDPTAAAIQSNEAGFQAQLARQQQQVAQANAQRALQQGQVREDQQRQKTAQSIGTRRALLASQGGDIGSGSAVDLVGDVARSGEFDALTARSAAQDRAYGYLLDAHDDAGQASLDDSRAANAWTKYDNGLIGSGLQAGASLLSQVPL